MAETNQFNYDEAKSTVAKIEDLTSSLEKVLNEMNGIVTSNVGNQQVWSGEAANNFKGRWNTFYEDNRDNFINTFRTQSNNINNAIENYHAWEQQNIQ